MCYKRKHLNQVIQPVTLEYSRTDWEVTHFTFNRVTTNYHKKVTLAELPAGWCPFKFPAFAWVMGDGKILPIAGSTVDRRNRAPPRCMKACK